MDTNDTLYFTAETQNSRGMKDSTIDKSYRKLCNTCSLMLFVCQPHDSAWLSRDQKDSRNM
jgi:hypothetical protein